MTVTTEPALSGPDVEQAPLVRRLKETGVRQVWVIAPVALYVLLVLLGVTQSSIGVDGLRQDPAHPVGWMVDEAQTIRSDEYLTSTPMLLGAMAAGSPHTLNPLAASESFFSLLPTGPVGSVVLFDGAVLRLGPLLPDQMLLAARWWLPFLLLALGAPAYFRSLTGSRWIGLFATVLIVFSPASAWWSFSPLSVLGFTLAGAAALQRCASALGDGRRWPAVAWGLTSAVLLARTPLHYQPWAIVLAPAVLIPAAVALLWDRDRRRTNLLALGATAGASVLLLVGVLWESRASIEASLGTLYPGARVATGGPNPLQEIFGASSLGSLEVMNVVGTNPSEISSSFAVAGLWAVLLVAYGLRFRDRAHRATTITALSVTAFWFAWSLVDFGALGGRIPVLNMVPPQRSSDVLGFLAIILLCLVLPGLVDRPRRELAVLAATSCALVAAHAGSLLRVQNLPDLSVRTIWATSLALGVVVLAITLRPRAVLGYALAGTLAFLLVWRVNPILFGLGDLRGSDVATTMLREGEEARSNGTAWASDNAFVDTLLVSTGVPSLSGRQIAGPDQKAWAALDPGRDHEEIWNRGGSYIWFSWNDDDELEFTNPSPDAIYISGSPCTVADRLPQLVRVVSSHELDDDCLTEVETFTWGQGPRWVYEVG